MFSGKNPEIMGCRILIALFVVLISFNDALYAFSTENKVGKNDALSPDSGHGRDWFLITSAHVIIH